MKELLKNRNVLIMWISRAFSRFGDSFESLALMYLVYDITDSALAMGTVMIFSMVPNVIVSPLAGVIIDRYNKKVIMFCAEIVRAVLILAIPVLMYLKLIAFWNICVIAVGVSIAESFFVPCISVVMKMVVRGDQLPLINSLLSTTNCIMRILGYSLAATAMAFLGKELIFMTDSITFLVSAIAAVLITIPELKVKKLESGGEILDDLMDGFRYVKCQKFILIILVSYFIINGTATPVMDFMPIFTGEMLRLTPSWAGYFMTVSSVGSVFGTILYPFLVKRKYTLEQAFMAGLVCCGVVLLLPCFFPHYITAMVLYLVTGIVGPILSAWGATYIQSNCDVRYLGRVASVRNIALLASTPLAAGIVGWAVDMFSLKITIEISAAVSIASGIILYKLFRKYKVVKKDIEAEAI